MEGREWQDGVALEGDMESTARQESMRTTLQRIRATAEADRHVRFTSLAHHITVEALREAWQGIQKGGAAGVDGVTARQYAEKLEENLGEFHERLRAKQYRPEPVRRAYIPKADGSRRPIGVPALEDKIVQRAVARLLGAIYEEDFLDFSYGFRPRRSPHQALEALTRALLKGKVNWVLEIDIRSFFDTVDRGWMMRFLGHRIADRGIHRLIAKWLRAGVMEEGKVTDPEMGTPQGGSISPMLANLYLHYAFDLWVERIVRPRLRGQMYAIRYCDDIVVCLQYRQDAQRVHEALKERLNKFGLELHPEKTRLLEFGRFAAQSRKRRGEGKPETFNFLGFTHICSQGKRGQFLVKRKPMRERMKRAMLRVAAWCRIHRHEEVDRQHAYLVAALRGVYQYYGVRGSHDVLEKLRHHVIHSWRKWLGRRSEKGRLSWRRYYGVLRKYPLPKVVMPHVRTQMSLALSRT